MGVYLRPHRLDEALDALHATPLTVLAGGTDFFPARVGQPLDDDVLDITAIDALHGIERSEGRWRLGALVTWSELIRASLPGAFDGLKAAAREVGGVQIQNAGTVVGNICNASPAADGVPPLLALDAEVELASSAGRRAVPLAEFITGNRNTVRRPDELVTGLVIPDLPPGTASSFLKLGARKYLVISIVMAGFVIEPDGDQVGRARVAVGACSPVAQRLPALEAALAGMPLEGALGDTVAESHLADALSPIDDIRGSGAYRADAALTIVRRGLSSLGGDMAAQRSGGGA